MLGSALSKVAKSPGPPHSSNNRVFTLALPWRKLHHRTHMGSGDSMRGWMDNVQEAKLQASIHPPYLREPQPLSP